MKVQLATNWQAISIITSFLVGIISLGWSIANTVIGKYVATKITDNELKHLTKDVEDLKNEDKDYKKNLTEELHSIGLRLGRIEKKIERRDAICEERHK